MNNLPYIIGVHPINEDLRFLRKLIRKLRSRYEGRFKDIRLSNRQREHQYCIRYLSSHVPNGIICFFCHGRTTGVLGCSYRAQRRRVDAGNFLCTNAGLDLMDPHSCHSTPYYDHYERYGELIDADTIRRGLFRGYKIFCLTCNSNDLGHISVSNGAKVFIGFDHVYFDEEMHVRDVNNPDGGIYRGTKVYPISKWELRKAIFSSLTTAIDNNLSFNCFVNYLKLYLDKANDRLVISSKGHSGRKYYLRAANSLQLIKEGIKIWGDGGVRMND